MRPVASRSAPVTPGRATVGSRTKGLRAVSVQVAPRPETRRHLEVACVAFVGALVDPMLTAVALTGGVLGWSAIRDLRERRVPTGLVLVAIAVVPPLLLIDAAQHGSTQAGASSLALGFGATATVALIWLCTPGIAFGDVLMLTAAILIPARLGLAAVVVLMAASLAVASGMVVARRLSSAESGTATVAFAPALFLGWIAAIASAAL